MKKEDPRKSKKSKIRKYILKYIRIVFPIISVVVCLFTISINVAAVSFGAWKNGLSDFPYYNTGSTDHWFATDLTYKNNVFNEGTPVVLTTNGQALKTYQSTIFYRDYSFWQSDTTTTYPVGMNTTDSNGVDHGHYHGHFYVWYWFLPRYYEYGGAYYDITKMYPRLVSSWRDRDLNLYKPTSFTSAEALDWPSSVERQAWLLSPDTYFTPSAINGYYPEGGTGALYVDGVRNYGPNNSYGDNYMYYQCPYVVYQWWLPTQAMLNSFDSVLGAAFEQAGEDVTQYVMIMFTCGNPFVLPKSTWQDSQYALFDHQLESFALFRDESGTHDISDYIDVPVDNDPDFPGIHAYDKALISPYLCLAWRFGSHTTGYLTAWASHYTGDPDKIIDYRYYESSRIVLNDEGKYVQKYPLPKVQVEIDINASASQVADVAIIAGLDQLQMSVDAQTTFLQTPDSNTQAEIDRVAAALTSSGSDLYDAIIAAETHPNVTPSDVESVLDQIDITNLAGALAWNNSQIVISLIVASMSCALIGFLLYGKRG